MAECGDVLLMLIYLTLKVSHCINCHDCYFKMHWDTFEQDHYSIVGWDGGCRVGEVRAGTTSPIPDHKGFTLQ